MRVLTHSRATRSPSNIPPWTKTSSPQPLPAPNSSAALVTAHGLEQLREAHERLRHRARVEITEGLRDARSYGEGANNDEHHAVLEERMVLEARIARLEQSLARVVVVDPQQIRGGAAAIGTTVLLEDLTAGGKRRYRIVGAHALDPGAISAASPMGQALLGETAGKVVTVELPNGRDRSVRLLAVEHRPRIRRRAVRSLERPAARSLERAA